jgi:thioredoxin-related protein
MNLKSLLASSIVLLGVFSTAFAEAKWFTNFEEAKKVALKEGKPLLLEFTGSDWCGPCMALRKNVLSTEEFTKEAAGKYVLVELDFPPPSAEQAAELKAQNSELKKRFAVAGYPTILLVDAQTGDIFGRVIGYRRSTTRQFLDKLAAFKNTPEGKIALVKQEEKEDVDIAKVSAAQAALVDKMEAAVDAKDFDVACKAIDQASSVKKAIASGDIDPANKARALKYLDEAIASDGGANVSALKAMRELIADGPATAPAAKPSAEAKKAAQGA